MRQSVNPRNGGTSIPDSSVDSNRLYSILLDARASSVSETMYDIAEKILGSEKENAKSALDRLWALKKNMDGQTDTATVDMLIGHYQRKLDIVRDREERIRTVSKDSRDLLEQKRKKNADIAAVKQEIEDCTREMERLTETLNKARTKEQELVLIENQLAKELSSNENEVVNGLYEIILAPPVEEEKEEEAEVNESGGVTEPFAEGESKEEAAEGEGDVREQSVDQGNLPLEQEPSDELMLDELGEEAEGESAETTETDETPVEDIHGLYRLVEKEDTDPFPKSVVKTTHGVVIGEYFYDPRVYKNERHYVFNSLFFMEHLATAVDRLAEEFQQRVFSEALQMIQDAYKRISGSPSLHLEVSTNEILNTNRLKELWLHLKNREYREVRSFCTRLHSKIRALGSNYRIMLKEQVQRLSQPEE